MKKLKTALYGIIIVATMSILLFCFQRKHEREKQHKKTIPYSEEVCEYFEQESGLNENEVFINTKGDLN